MHAAVPTQNKRDQFDWFSAYLNGRGLQIVWRLAAFFYATGAALLPLVLLASPVGPDNPLTVAISVGASLVATFGALVWLLHWPTRGQSIAFALASTLAIAATCLSLSNPYSGLMGCTMFAVVGGFVAYFHTLDEVLINLIVATGCVVILAINLVSFTGDVALTGAAVVIVASLNVGVPFGIHSMVQALRTDLRRSDRDPLTGLHNRRSFHHSVYELIMGRQSAERYLVVTVIDLDNFKLLNDTLGHAAGDEALRSVGIALQKHSHRTAVIGRSGGEEFVIADVGTRPEPRHSSERLLNAIAEIPTARITASIGTASALLGGRSVAPVRQLIDDLINVADVAMYQAKRAGGNQVCHHRDILPTGRA